MIRLPFVPPSYSDDFGPLSLTFGTREDGF